MANNESQATCEGGQSTGPHQHFSLKQNGSFVSLHNVYLSGHRVNVGTVNYDTNCNRFWIEKPNGQKSCANSSLYNPGVSGTDPDPDPTPGTLQNGVAKNNLSANSGSELNYTFSVPSGATNIKIAMSGGSGDADLYVKRGSQPTDNSYDCRPYASGNNESCDGSQSGTYYVRLKAYSNFSGVTLKASYTPGGTDPNPGTDPIDVTENNISASQGQWTRFTQVLGAGYSTMTITMSGGTGDADLYVNHGSQSTANNWDCRPYKNGNNEICTINSPASGTWYIDVYGYSTASGVSINLKAN